jgi:hypothetical protein
MGDEANKTALTVHFTVDQIEAIDAWIARSRNPEMSREDAVVQIVTGRLGAHGPSTILPDPVTGRDIV